MSEVESKKVNEEALEKATSIQIKQEDIERAQLIVNVDRPSRAHEQSTTASYDSIRQFSRSIGDDNPLFTDEHYGRGTRWGGQIAPGPILNTINSPMLTEDISAELKAKTRSLFKGIHAFMSGGSYEWYRPVRPGDRVFGIVAIESVEEKRSSMAGRSVFVRHREISVNQHGEVLGLRRWLMVHVERKAAREKGKYTAIEPAVYTDADIEKVDEVYRNEKRRGATPRYWEDVEIGDALGPIAKGPLTLTEMLVLHAGGAMMYPFLSASRLWYQNRQQFPAFYMKNQNGVPDVGQRVHWDTEWAKAIGNPMPYDYGFTRTCWLHHLLTDWAGDDGYVVHQQEDITKFNYIGDYHILTGKVIGKANTDGVASVEVSTEATNQRGQITASGTAKIQLPSRAHGEVKLLEPDPTMAASARRMVDRHHELEAARLAKAGLSE